MIRVWLLSYVVACSVNFLQFSPDQDVYIPKANQVMYKGELCCKMIPAEVFYYQLYENVGLIVIGGIMISMVIWPIDKKYVAAFVSFGVIQVVDIVLYRIYYRGWFSEAITWNMVKVTITGIITLWMQIRRPISL